jgi:uncharacterized membrane protein
VSEEILGYLELASHGIGLFAVVVILGGFASASVRYALGLRALGRARGFLQFKVELGRALLLGLEILVLADVIETITVKPTFESLAILAMIVVIRTVVSWTVTLETEGSWPWQEAAEEIDDA